MSSAPKVSVGLGTKLGIVLTVLSAGLGTAVASGASIGIGSEALAIMAVASGLVTTAGRMLQSGWNTAPSVETDAGTVVPGAPAPPAEVIPPEPEPPAAPPAS